MMVHPEMALGLAIVVAFLSESTHHGAELRRMQRDGRELATQLRAANGQVENLERALTRRHVELNSAIEELQRRHPNLDRMMCETLLKLHELGKARLVSVLYRDVFACVISLS